MKRPLALMLLLALCAGPAAAALFPDNAFSDDARGAAGSQFLKVPPSARFAALAGAGLALSGPDAFFLNPAGAYGRRGALSVSYESQLEDSSRTGMVLTRPSRLGTLSAGFLYNDLGRGLRAFDGAGSAGSGITAYDAAVAAGWARRYGWVDAGLNLKFIKSRLAEASGTSAALDAGAVFRSAYPSRTELAVAMRNFGPPLKLGSEAAPLPFELAGAIKWKYASDFNILFEGRMPCDHAPYLVFAGELFLPYAERSGLFLRSGINFKNYDDHGVMGAFAGGFGLKFGGLSVDYAFSPYGELGSAHRVTAGLAWGASSAADDTRPAAGAALLVAPFEAGVGVKDTEASVVRNLVEAELSRTGRFRLVEREKLDYVLKEKKLAYAGLSEQESAAELGRLSGAGRAVFGFVSLDGNGYLVTARMVDVATGDILRSAAIPVAEDYLFRDAARRIAAAFAK